MIADRCQTTGRFLPGYLNDPFDPRGWPEPVPFKTIWLRPEENLFCVVDDEDHAWATQWLWAPHPNSTGNKFYATRTGREGGKKPRIYMHKEILLRACGAPPSPRHVIGDHLDGNSLNNRRSNLRWATPSENNKNRYGFYVKQIRMAF